MYTKLENYLTDMRTIAESMKIPLADVLSADRNLFLGDINLQVESISDEIESGAIDIEAAVLNVSKEISKIRYEN